MESRCARGAERVRGSESLRAAAGAAAADLAGIRLIFHLEGVAAAAARDGVRVVDLEAGLLDRLEIVDPRTRQVRGAEGIDDDTNALTLELVVALLGAAVEAEAVLESGAAAALDRHAEHRHVGLLGHQGRDLRRRRGRQRDELLRALLDLHRAPIVPRRRLVTSIPKVGSL